MDGWRLSLFSLLEYLKYHDKHVDSLLAYPCGQPVHDRTRIPHQGDWLGFLRIST